MADKDAVEALKLGTKKWNEWKSNFGSIDLSGIDFGQVSGLNNWRHNNPHEIGIPADIILQYAQLNFNNVNLKGADFSNHNIMAIFDYADLTGAKFNRSQVLGSFVEANITNADFSNARLENSDFKFCEGNNINFIDATISHCNLNHANLPHSDFTRAEMREAYCYEANFENSNFTSANLEATYFHKANFKNSIFTDTNFHLARLMETNFENSKLIGTNLERSILTQVNFKKATILNCRVYGISAWDNDFADSEQKNLSVNPLERPTILVDELEVAQFIYLLVNNKNIKKVFNTITERGVLILGRFSSGGLELLHAIAAKLRDLNYIPIIFDFEKPSARNYTETIKTLAGLSRFIIVDISGPSVPQELYATVPHFKIPFVPIVRKGTKVYSMFNDILEYPWVVAPIEYSSKKNLMDLISTSILSSAEKKFHERQKILDQLFKT